jgi:acyl carrier protein
MKSTIRDFIVETFPTGRGKIQLDDQTSFLESGIIDSTGVLELVAFLEDDFGIIVEDSELVPENLDSISNICGYLESKGVKITGTPQDSENENEG